MPSCHLECAVFKQTCNARESLGLVRYVERERERERERESNRTEVLPQAFPLEGGWFQFGKQTLACFPHEWLGVGVGVRALSVLRLIHVQHGAGTNRIDQSTNHQSAFSSESERASTSVGLPAPRFLMFLPLVCLSYACSFVALSNQSLIFASLDKVQPFSAVYEYNR